MYAAGSKADGKVSGKRYHSFKTDAAKFCRLTKLQLVDDGGEGGGVELVGGTTTAPPPEPLPPPHADTPAARMSTMHFNDCFVMPIPPWLASSRLSLGAPDASRPQVTFPSQIEIK